MLDTEKKNLMYEPNVSPERDYWSDDSFHRHPEEIAEEINTPEQLERIKEEIFELLGVLDVLPEDLKKIKEEILKGIVKDIDSLPEYIPEEPEDDSPITPPVDEDSEPDIPGETEEDTEEYPPPTPPTIPAPEWEGDDEDIVDRDRDPSRPTIPWFDREDIDVKMFPDSDPIELNIEEPMNFFDLVNNSFLKDKADLYEDYVHKLSLMIRQYMKEILYVAEAGGFDSYLDLYIKFLTPTGEVDEQFRHTTDKITKNQIERDQKTRYLRKVFDIDNMIYHLRSNKSTYEQRKRYYGVDYIEAEDFIDTQENDELRRIRREYDTKYEKSMYNYYKFLTGATILTDEILKTFLSEARGKAILNRAGIDTELGLKKENEKKEKIEKEQEKEAEKTKKEIEEKNEKEKKKAEEAGKDETYSGSYGDKTGSVKNDSSSIGGSDQGSSGSLPPVTDGDFMTPTVGQFTSGFKMRWGRMHRGIDIANRSGTPIVAAADGIAVRVGWVDGYKGGFGNTVMLEHNIGGQTMTTVYAHMRSLSVSQGTVVKKGQKIGEMGSTGNSTGPHLHFEVHIGKFKNTGPSAQNPLNYVKV